MNFILNTLLGFLIFQIYGLLTREKNGKFNLIFFIKDTWVKIVLSLSLSITLAVATHFNYVEVFKLFGSDTQQISSLIYLIIGAVPEVVLQIIRKRFGVLYSSNEQSSIGGGGIKNPPPKDGNG